MKKAEEMHEIARRFHFRYRIAGSRDEFVYDCTFNYPQMGRAPKHNAETALVEFHQHMQRKMLHPADSYRITRIWDTYAELDRRIVEREYDVPGGPNPTALKEERVEEATEAFSDPSFIAAMVPPRKILE